MKVRPSLLILLLLVAVLAIVALPRLRRVRLRPGESRLSFVSELTERQKTGYAVRMALNARQFDQLQAMADTLVQGGYFFSSGIPQIQAFHVQGFRDLNDEASPEQWQTHLDRLREWNDARPNSILARIALAEGLIGRAWAARGEGWAKDVSRQRWARFEADMDEAGQILRQCPPEAQQDPEWWENTMQVLHAQGRDADSLYRVVGDSALRRFPEHWPLYGLISNHLLPRWYGEPGDWQRFAERCAADLPAPLGDEVYARIVVEQVDVLANVFHDGADLSWERLNRGLDAWQAHYPETHHARAARALLAWEAGRREDAQRAFAQLGDAVEVDLWFNASRFLSARRWAAGDDAQAAPDHW